MFYLFILESIGTSELLLIGLVALIVFGPRKLPELARMLGKARNEFKRTTDDFKETWMREVEFDSQGNQIEKELPTESTVQRSVFSVDNEIAAPEVKELSQAEFTENLQPEIKVPTAAKTSSNGKQDWL
jgi:Tat protein translocase TatB subunit